MNDLIIWKIEIDGDKLIIIKNSNLSEDDTIKTFQSDELCNFNQNEPNVIIENNSKIKLEQNNEFEINENLNKTTLNEVNESILFNNDSNRDDRESKNKLTKSIKQFYTRLTS